MSINLSNGVPREKYIDEMPATADWFIFGVDPEDTNLVDISWAQDDVFTKVPKTLADKIIELRSNFTAELFELIKEYYK